MINWFYALIPVAVVLIWLYLKRSKAESSSSQKTGSTAGKRVEKFRAVSIRVGPRVCTAAKYLRGKRFISTQVPELPLSMCDISDCKCKYVYHKDRRAEDDRRFPSHIMQSVFADNNKRTKSKSGRRNK
jgi:hypothetical protein